MSQFPSGPDERLVLSATPGAWLNGCVTGPLIGPASGLGLGSEQLRCCGMLLPSVFLLRMQRRKCGGAWIGRMA